MRRSLLVSCAALLGSLTCLLSGPVAAQATDGYALNLLDAAQRGSEWFATETLDLRGDGRVSLGLVTDWSHRPLVAKRDGGGERALVRNQLFVQPGISLVWWERVRVALDVPLLLYTDGKSLTHDGVRYLAPEQRVRIGDVRLGMVVRLFGSYGDWITGALAVHVWLPTGKQSAYVGDGATRVMPQLLIAGDHAGFAYAAKLAAAFRGTDHELLDATLGHYAYFALSAGVRMFDRRFVLGPELLGTTGLTGDAFFKRRTTPLEALLGMHYCFDNGLRLGLGIGFGISSGLGSPEQRGLLSVEWNSLPPAQPTAAVADRDGDGIPDRNDTCADQYGSSSDNPLLNGCPRPVDTDRDGVRDEDDACPEHPGEASEDDAVSGCPKPKDTDADGVPDAQDACPGEAGVAASDPQQSGCPPPRDE
jgi:OmpA-OmpF porin, OOP family